VILYPAVDILDGKAVRLVRGDFDERTVYEDRPLDAALAWIEAGAEALHVVDLDGARAGEPRNLEAIAEICAETGVPVQVGGGLRAREHVDAALGAGASRVVVGTAAYRDPALLDAIVAQHGAGVAVAVDVREGRVSAAGWTEDTGLDPLAAIAELQRRGVDALVYTNVDRDGMLAGPDVDEARRVAEAVSGSLVWSGGVGELAHLEALAALPLEGVIVGKALYERRFTVAEGNAALAGTA
jgi:phosphoribosylformimino-5-aminoimidazole carboxamide ribotide isomerase